MVRPNYIPRTLKGVGGVRLFNIPGVVYPPELLHAKSGTSRKSGRPYAEAPAWGIPTQEAARILDCTAAAARSMLHKKRVLYRLVAKPGGVPCIYWKKEQVEQLAHSRPPKLSARPAAKLLTAQECMELLGVVRSSLYRYTKAGRLREMKVRQKSDKGLRVISYYLRSDVERLARRLTLIREKEAELRRLIRGEGEEICLEELPKL